MINEKKAFSNLNADDAIRFLGENEYLNMENMRLGVSEFGYAGSLQNIPSTQLLDTIALPDGDNLTIGRVSDISTNRLIRFNWNSNGEHGIYAQDLSASITYIVLLSSQTLDGLNFSKAHRIDRNARVVGNLLIWTDDYNEPKCINIEAGIKLNQPGYITDVYAYRAPIPQTSITVIVRPPIYRLQVTKIIDGGFPNNFIATNSYQFYYRYWYKDYQYSVLSTFSKLVPFNSNTDTFNAITVSMPFGEDVPDECQQVDFCFRDGNYGKSFVIRSWNKSNPYDLMAIESHNANAVALGLTFYDNIAGIAIDEITANTSFDDVALLAETLEAAKNRLFFGNVLKGYNSPSVTSLAFTVVPAETGADLIGRWATMQITYSFEDREDLVKQYYYLLVQPHNPSIYFYPAIIPPSVPPSTIDLADATYGTTSYHGLATYIATNSGLDYTRYEFEAGEDVTPYTSTISGGGTGLGSGDAIFKSNNTYRVAISFYDRYRRKSGLVIPLSPDITMPERTYEQTVWNAGINWTLSNNDAISQIPDWAYYYQIYITKSQTTRFFEQARASDITYVIKNDDGTYTYNNDTWDFANPRFAIAININILQSFGYGYVFAEGDYVMLYFAGGTNYNLSVIGQDGNWVLIAPQDLGTLNETVNVLFELYTPYKASVTEPYYETGDMYAIQNPTTSLRSFSVLSDFINGDVYILERAQSDVEFYFVETMSPNDKVWQIWQTDRGWPNFIDTIGQQLKETNIDWSDTIINGSKTNGLNKFEPLNTKDIGISSGAIQKLQLTNKQQENGNVMLVITVGDSLSAYLQEIQLYKAATVEGLITTDEVIGTINPHQNGRGTLNPESVVEYNGTVWWWDVIHGVVAQYAQNGVTTVTDYKLTRFADRWSKRYMILGRDAVEALCGFSYIDSCVDVSTDEVMFMLPQVEENTIISGIPVGFAQPLPSYNSVPIYASSIQNRFNVYDGQPKLISYKYLENKWQGCYLWLPDCMDYIGNKLIGYKNGQAWLHNEDNTVFNTIYGIEYPQRICFTANLNPSVIRDVMQLAIEGNFIAPTFTVTYSESPYIQISDLASTDVDINGEPAWQNDESVLDVTILRDRLSPNATGTADDKLYTGDVIKSAYPLFMLEFQEYNEQLAINMANIGFAISKGHNNILQKPKKD